VGWRRRVADRITSVWSIPIAAVLHGLEVSPACIFEGGLDRKKEEYQRKIVEAMSPGRELQDRTDHDAALRPSDAGSL